MFLLSWMPPSLLPFPGVWFKTWWGSSLVAQLVKDPALSLLWLGLLLWRGFSSCPGNLRVLQVEFSTQTPWFQGSINSKYLEMSAVSCACPPSPYKLGTF